MLKYESKKNPGSFLTTDGVVDPKTKTLFVTVDGKEKTISVATLKRWWTPVEEEPETPAAAPEEPVVAPEEPAATQAEPESIPEEPETTQAEPETTQAEPEAQAQKPKKRNKGGRRASEMKPPEEDAIGIREAVSVVSRLFDALNDAYFDGLLPKPVIGIARYNRAYDAGTVRKVGDGEYELSLYVNAFGRPLKETAAALMHTMVHLYCMEAGITETCQKGRYHNAHFKKECEDRGLTVEYDSANGYVHTSATEDFLAAVTAAGFNPEESAGSIPVKVRKVRKTERR